MEISNMAKKQLISEDDMTRKMLNRLRSINEGITANNDKKGVMLEGLNDRDAFLLVEEAKNAPGAIAITDDPKFGTLALRNQVDQFRSTVESGAQFSKPEAGKVAESPLIYIPSNGNVIFSGVIPCLNNLKWQMVLKTTTGNGCFMWSDGLILNKDNLQILNKLYGFYENWKDQWNSEARDLDTVANNDFF